MPPVRGVFSGRRLKDWREYCESFDKGRIRGAGFGGYCFILRNRRCCFRSGNVGVFHGGQLVHAGTPAKFVPEVMAQLFDWLRTTSMHPLIKSCVFHYGDCMKMQEEMPPMNWPQMGRYMYTARLETFEEAQAFIAFVQGA